MGSAYSCIILAPLEQSHNTVHLLVGGIGHMVCTIIALEATIDWLNKADNDTAGESQLHYCYQQHTYGVC